MIRIEDEETGHGENWFIVGEVAKMLNLKDKKGLYYGRNKMYKLLRDEKILMENGNYPYQYFIGMGLVQMHKVVRGNYTVFLPIFSMRGVNYLKNRFNKIN